jgi:uncharacterized protein
MSTRVKKTLDHKQYKHHEPNIQRANGKGIGTIQDHFQGGLREGQNLANIVRPLRSVLFKTPDDYGMTGWRNIYSQSGDGIPLEGWYIPAKGGKSDKADHLQSRSSDVSRRFSGHLGEPCSMHDAVEIDFAIQQKHLSDAGYNVLAYDIRNYGTSSAANAGISGIGRWEWRDCVGVKKYVDATLRSAR